MTDLAPNQALLLIEDRLDAIGQRYRLQRWARGAMLWLGFAIAASVVAAFAAHGMREGFRTMIVAALWGAWLLSSGFWWLVRPMFLRPGNVEVARLVEKRVDGLHNGLTNSVLLSRATDLAASPFMGQIFSEIARDTLAQPLEKAVTFADLKPLAARMLALAGPAVIVALIFHGQFAHGFEQMFAPGHFVPQTGQMEIVSVEPGDVTLVLGQPLEIAVIARGNQTPDAHLIFEGQPPISLSATAQADGTLRYGYRVEHVDQTIRYRAEVGVSQTPWYTASVVREVKLTGMDLFITAPPYTHLSPATMNLKPDEIAQTPVIVPQGSMVRIGVSIDVAADKGLLQVGDSKQLDMESALENHRFFQTITVMGDTSISVGILEGQQMVAKFPAAPLFIKCKMDAPPRIDMKWPTQDGTTTRPSQDLTIEANLHDDYGLTAARILVGAGDATLSPAAEEPAESFAAGGQTHYLRLPIHLTADQAKLGKSIRIQIEATDNRDLRDPMKALGTATDDGSPQTTHGPVLEIKFANPDQIANELRDQIDELSARLMQMLKAQQDMLDKATVYKPGDAARMNGINAGQVDLRNLMTDTADKFLFDPHTMIVKRTLQMLAVNPAKEAIDISAAIQTEPVVKEQGRLSDELRARQRTIITTLQSLLAMLRVPDAPTTQPGNGDDPLKSRADAYKKLDEALQKYIKEQQKIMDETASLAKKNVADFDDADKKRLADLQIAQENLDAFMQQQIADFSKNAEQDMSNPQLLKDLFQIQDETTMAKDALKQQASEIAVSLEENGLALAKEVDSNMEKWLGANPDRQQWTQEDPVAKTDTPMPELPTQLQDMVGQLLEQQEDLFQQMEDANANWQDSIPNGWNAADGPIADMSAQGVTGNVLPNNNEMQGRSGEGRSGQSQGEFVGDTAVGKGGRNTPTRLDPTPFEKGTINDTSKDPTGGATGGGKLSGEGGHGLEGPVPNDPKAAAMKRLAQMQAELRNAAERLNIQYKLGRYDNFKLLQSIALMRRVESDIDANRYDNALRRRDILLDNLSASKMLLGGQVDVQLDADPVSSGKTQQDINDAMKGELPPAWSDALKEYYEKLSQQ